MFPLIHDASANTSAYLVTWATEKMYLLSRWACLSLGADAVSCNRREHDSHTGLKTTSMASNPKDPCTYMVYAWALKLLYRNLFKAQVYTI